ncbi:phosphatase PAP2 family protein [Candidatus Berkiella cookevillensis]|uniref:undecaprenyl-diphosphate phosphatase n=1 Tax=Candidatus Berkiella cookevillensis TaxID=437022 RepID=A0A0Q9YE96_9GAMM|nr:phosphatase PAP2 family protein [Candidatus Berkiella cookevillensis]MCS5707290.1 phosphatase PAP2 family protein [Candidatus Berkiella cookevillensis]
MFSYIEHELALIRVVLAYRPECLNPLFIFLNHLDTGPYYMLVGVIAFTLFNPKLGKRCFLLFALVFASNHFFKYLLMQPRPLVLDPLLGLIKTNSQYGLPSGGAQGAISLALFFVHYYKNTALKIFAIFYVVIVCISRIYLGMHFFSDVIVGCLLGALLTKLFLATIEDIEEYMNKLPASLFYLGGAFIMVMALYFKVPAAYVISLSEVLGVFSVTYLLFIFKVPETYSLKIRVSNMILGILSLVAVMHVKEYLPQDAVSALIFLQLQILALLHISAKRWSVDRLAAPKTR